MVGRQFAARVAASLLHAVGLPELVATDRAGYEVTAAALAADPAGLALLRRRLAANRLHAPLFATAAYTRRLETAFAQMHERHHSGLSPDHFNVD